jgi:uncharacterized protein DUF6152
MNPHAHLYLDVRGDSGEITKWDFELGSPNALLRAGWTKYSLKIGDEVVVKGCRSKDAGRAPGSRNRTVDSTFPRNSTAGSTPALAASASLAVVA